MDQDATWHAGMVGLGPGNSVLDVDPTTPKERAQQPPPTFEIYGRRLYLDLYWCNPRPMSIVAKLLDGSRCHLVWPRPRRYCVRWGPAPPKGHTPPNFRPMSIVVQRSPISATAEHFYFLKISANDLRKSEIICTNFIFCRDK